jgi:hypothetical protein
VSRVFLADGNRYFNRPGPRLPFFWDLVGIITRTTRGGAW